MKEIIIIFVSLFLTVPLFAADEVRFTGAPLERSSQNESNAAIDRATDWLLSQQNEKGYWGDEDHLLTAVATLAIAGSNSENRKTPQIKKAVDWLKSPSCTSNKTVRLKAILWREIALTVFAPDAIDIRPLRICKVTDKIRYAFYEIIFLRKYKDGKLPYLHSLQNYRPQPSDVIFLSYYKKNSYIESAMETLAKEWSSSGDVPEKWKEDAEMAWWYAHAINRAFNGEIYLKSNGEITPINWRAPLANHWTTTQTMDAKGRGNWKNSILETAFAILLLSEL